MKTTFPKLTAFPHSTGYEHQQGMALRDYFAARAMQSIMVDPNTSVAKDPSENDDIAIGIAKFAYMMADAMLAEREK